MISAVGFNTAMNSIAMSKKAGVSNMDASLNEGKSQGMYRAVQRKEALNIAAQPWDAKTSNDNQHVGPARQVALDKALGRGGYSEQALMMILALSPNTAPGPKSASAVRAEAAYLQARAAI